MDRPPRSGRKWGLNHRSLQHRLKVLIHGLSASRRQLEAAPRLAQAVDIPRRESPAGPRELPLHAFQPLWLRESGHQRRAPARPLPMEPPGLSGERPPSRTPGCRRTWPPPRELQNRRQWPLRKPQLEALEADNFPRSQFLASEPPQTPDAQSTSTQAPPGPLRCCVWSPSLSPAIPVRAEFPGSPREPWLSA